MIRIPIKKTIGPLVWFTLIWSATTLAWGNPFPQFDVIEPNVTFWKRVYTEFDTTQAIVHDSINLNIIYETIDLVPHDAPGARKTNRKRMKRAKMRYQGLLKRLARNPDIKNANCRQVAKLFGSQATAETYRRARKNIRCQIGQNDRFAQGLIQSGAYIDEIRDIFKSHGLPEDLAFLPHVESSFNVKAYSKFGAAGIWQFTRSTGKRFMKVGYVLDERRDPIRASHAAAQLLKDNYKKLGSWPLAITAYNHGATGMSRAKRKHGRYPEIFKSYRSRTFKFASRNFYAEFLAAREVADNYVAYFGNLVLDRPSLTKRVPIEGYVLFEDLCAYFHLSPERLKSHNPALRKPVYEGQKYVPKGYTLRIPASAHGIGAVSATVPTALYKSKQKPSNFYTVQRGDTAGKIARRHGIKLKALILANNLSRRATIYPHQTLRIPHSGESPPVPIQPPVVDQPPILLASNDQPVPTTPSAIPIEPEPEVYPTPLLASVLPTTPRKEAAIPTISEPSGQIPDPGAMTAEVSIMQTIAHQGQPVGIIQVEVEETLGHYAEWARVPTWRIRRLNQLAYGRTLHLHQKVKIPLDQISAQAFEQERYEYHKRLQEDFFAVYRINALQPYRIEQGDNYWTLCRDKFDIPMWLLRHCNPEVDFAMLRAHQRLMVPAVEEISETASISFN